MILVTKRQVGAFLFLWQATEHGTKTWTGIVRVEGMAQENVGDCLSALRRKGALDWAMTLPRTYRLLVRLEDLNVQERKVLQAQGGDFLIERGGIRDGGAFMDAVRRAKVVFPPDDPEADGDAYVRVRGLHRPDARTL